MRLAGIALVGIAACGRIGFDAGTDAQPSAAGDGPVVAGFTRVRAYGDSTCALYAGALYCWGADAGGQLGDVGSTPKPLPQKIPVPQGHVDDFSIGDAHACAIVDAHLFCWGTLQSLAAVNLVSMGDATAVATGRNFTCAVIDGAVACFGENDVGQLGRGTMGADQWALQAVSLVGTPVAVDAGDDHACATTSDAKAWCWGHDDDGTIGANVSTGQALKPAQVLGGVSALPRIAGWHACAYGNGTLQCWGEGDHGELGDGSLAVKTSAPKTIALGFAIDAVETGGGAADFDSTCAVRTDGGVACWGVGLFGRLGDGATANQPSPVQVAGLPAGVRAVEVAVGYDHACARLADGALWCWGKNTSGQLGRGTQTDHEFAPMPVTAPAH